MNVSNTNSLEPGIASKLPKHRWQKQKNGRFAIFKVPIFSLFNDDERGEVNESDAKEIVSNFQKDAQNGYFPRIHVGHQASGSVENKEGAGYLDNLSFSGKDFYADWVDIPKKIFQKIKDLVFHGRSVEYSPDKKKILSLALLESQTPFFQYPIVSLSDTEGVAFQSGRVFQFQLFKEEDMSWLSFQKNKKMCDEEDMEKKENFIDEEMDDESFDDGETEEVEDIPDSEIEDVPPVGPSADEGKMDQILESVNSLTSMLQKLFMPAAEASAGDVGESPGSLSMQTDYEKLLFAQNQEVKELRAAVAMFMENQSRKDYKKELRKICNGTSLNFQLESSVLAKMKSPSACEAYLDGARMRAQSYQKHAASRLPLQFAQKEKSETMKFIEEQPEQFQDIAKLAYQAFMDTLEHSSERDAKAFAKTWRNSPKFFVEHVVGMSESDPKYLYKLCRN